MSDGWKLVPVVPTEAMLKAGDLPGWDEAVTLGLSAKVWRAMLAAAPAPQPAQAPVQCCMCGKTGLSTVEGDGGQECELSDGRWVCSMDCWERATAPQPAEEPVAYRHRYIVSRQGDLSDWFYTDAPAAPDRSWRGFQETPLYAAPPTYQQGVDDGLRRAAEECKQFARAWGAGRDEEAFGASCCADAILALIPTTPEECGR